ncbi:MAG: hypothetical protein AUJ71_01285 [Candidatus Omnitrophica bacterium CG1_02_49_16]|nr:MAG: hypothetical protein AUJ71_01285 [Candidatus Omnitrophica bacterium CG1_02_49_16]
MRRILIVMGVLFLATFVWGWFINVYRGPMDAPSYAGYYWREVNRQASHYFEEAQKVIENIKKPLPARKEFQL